MLIKCLRILLFITLYQLFCFKLIPVFFILTKKYFVYDIVCVIVLELGIRMTDGQLFALIFPKEKNVAKMKLCVIILAMILSDRPKIRFKLSRSDIINYNFIKNSELFRN